MLSYNLISNKIYRDTILIASSLIKLYPVYGSETQEQAQMLLCDYLKKNKWDIYIDNFHAGDIIDKNFMRRPWEYDPIYKYYEDIARTNIYAILDSGKEGKTLLLNGHVDVDIINKAMNSLNNEGQGFIKDGKLWGRGAADMLVGLSCFCTINDLLKNIDWAGKVIVTSVVDEELCGNGSIRACEWLVARGLLNEKTECIIAEPTHNIITNQTMGFLPFTIIATNKVQHMNGFSHDDILLNLTETIKHLYMLKDYDSNITINMGLINGGIDPSLPIPELTIKGVISSTLNCNNDKIKSFIADNLLWKVSYPKMDISPCAFNTFTVGRRYMSDESSCFRSSCDAAVFFKFGIPTIIFGPGNLEQAHCENEFIEIVDIKTYVNILLEIICEYLGA
jgi:acetylornithine deacetylase/succinyl-diaminopimelate desuccinylase-like protein